MKNTKELEGIKKAITKWCKKHNNDVAFIGCFNAFDEKDEVIDDLIIGYGSKEVMKINLKELDKMLKEEKEDFINW